MLHCSRIQLAHPLQSIDWAVLLSKHLFTQVLTLTWCQLQLQHLQCLHQLWPLILQSILLPNLWIPWNLKSPSWMLWHLLEHAKRKGLSLLPMLCFLCLLPLEFSHLCCHFFLPKEFCLQTSNFFIYGSVAERHHEQFKASLKSELEMPDPMITSAATTVCDVMHHLTCCWPCAY